MAQYTLYGIKNCDTLKKAKAWLEEHAITYRFHDFRADGLTPAQLQNFAARTDWATLVNKSSTSWRQLSPAEQSDLSQEKALALCLNTPTLLKRPILDTGEKLIVGFKPEKYLTELL